MEAMVTARARCCYGASKRIRSAVTSSRGSLGVEEPAGGSSLGMERAPELGHLCM